MSVYKELSNAFNKVVSQQQEIFETSTPKCRKVVRRYHIPPSTVCFLIFCQLLVLLSTNYLSASPIYACRELSRRDFLKEFNLSRSGVQLLRQLLEDQIEALTQLSSASRSQRQTLESCIQKRWAQLAEIVRRLDKEQLAKAETHVLLARMKSLQGLEESASQSLFLALNLEPNNVEALHLSSQRARNRGNRDLERTLLRSITDLDSYKKDPDLEKIFEESFERYSHLASSSETLALVEGPWKELNKSSLTRIRRALEVSALLGDVARMKKFFEEFWGKGDLGDAPDWALYQWANMKLLEKNMLEAVAGFDRYVRKRKSWDQDYCKHLNAYLETAETAQSWKHLRRWSELILQQECAKRIAGFDKARITALHLKAIEMGAVDPQNPVKDLDAAQILNPDRLELALYTAEVVLGQKQGLRPESPYTRSSLAFKKARAYLLYLQTGNQFLADAAHWKFWMEWRLGRASRAKENADEVLLELQKGSKFYRVSTRDQYWKLLGDLVVKMDARREYRARLKHLASDAQVSPEDRAKAQELYQFLGQESAS